MPSNGSPMRLILVCFLVAACSNDNNGPSMMGDDTQQPPDAGNTTPVTPQVGAWDYDSVTPVSRTCPGNVQHGGVGAFGIDQASATSFHVIPNDGTAAFTCSLNGSAFNCPDRLTNTQDLRPAIDAVLTGHAVATGTFSSATRATGRQSATVTCAGTQCGQTGITFPCSIMVDFAIQAR